MLTGAVLLGAVLVAALSLRALRRRRRDEIRSVHHYHDRLDTLHVEPHDRGGAVRVVAVPDAEIDSDRARPGRPRVQLDASGIDSTPEPSAAERRQRHGRSWALGRMEPRARVDTATLLIVTVVLAALVALGVAGYLLRNDESPTSTPTTTTTTVGHGPSVRDASLVARRAVVQSASLLLTESPAPSRSSTNA